MKPVYKYCGAFGTDVLRNLELKVTPPNQFNDPFEFTPRVIYSDPRAYACRVLASEQNLRKLYEDLCSDGKYNGTFDNFRRIVESGKPDMISILAEAPHHTTNPVEKAFLDEASTHYGVLCVSDNPDSVLMWGHYCHRERGLVIGLDRSADLFQQGDGFKPVVYSNKRVVIDACWMDGSPEQQRYLDEIVRTKSEVWCYESEQRQIVPLSSLKQKPVECGRIGYFLSIPPEVVVSVILGPRSSKAYEEEVTMILHESNLSHVTIHRAWVEGDGFSIRFEQVR